MSNENQTREAEMIYSKENCPPEMKELPDEVRRKAIQITNEMMIDGDIRHHEDLIIAIAISRAKEAKHNA